LGPLIIRIKSPGLGAIVQRMLEAVPYQPNFSELELQWIEANGVMVELVPTGGSSLTVSRNDTNGGMPPPDNG
jgi:hypothetical protein